MNSPDESPDKESPQPDILFSAVVVEGGIGVLALAIGWYRGFSPWSSIEWNLSGLLWGVVGTLPPLLVGWLMLRFPIGPLRKLKAVSLSLVRRLFSGCRLWHLAFVSAWAGVGEELLFRGIVQDWATKQFGLAAGLVVGSLIFGMAHPLSALYFGITALMGLYLGWLWHLSGNNLLVPILVHGLYDFGMLFILVRLNRRRKHA